MQTAQPRALGLESSVYSKRHPKAVREEMLHVFKKKPKNKSPETKLTWTQQPWLYSLTLVFCEPKREMESEGTRKGGILLPVLLIRSISNCSDTSGTGVPATGTANFWAEEFVYILTNTGCFVD